MARCGLRAGRDSGFTLLEVILACVILATSLVAIVAIHVRMADLAAAARDLTIAASNARNAMEEAFVDYAETEQMDDGRGAEGSISERPSLRLRYRRSSLEPEGDTLPLTVDFQIDIMRDGEEVLKWVSKRALYVVAEPQAAAGETPDD